MLSADPVVTVVVPMLNESGFIDDCLDGFAKQTYPLEHLDVVVVDGGSTDGSRQVVEARAAANGWLRVIDNPARIVSAAFNRGIEAARGEIVCLFSAHGVPDPDYISRSVAVLRETGAAGVGGRYLHVGTDRQSSAIGLAMVSWFGMASPHRFAGTRTDVDTISHPAYLRSALVDIGPFDEALTRNEDYELNYRLRAAGERLVFDPSVASVYRPRPGLSAMARQFYWYGRGKAAVIRRHPRSLRPRHLVPPAAVAAGSVALPALLAGPSGRRVAAAGAAAYVGLAAAAVVSAHPSDHDASPALLALCFPLMHAAWGTGFLVTLLRGAPVRPEPRATLNP
ncbi:MAG: glycosyltransferase family 2 protein [Acidimicrobiia bacterium]|nr:glycosyltransferase family 2 protein [Acidimicrobiia bacterium]